MTALLTATLKRKCNSACIIFLELATTLVSPSAPQDRSHTPAGTAKDISRATHICE